MPRPGAVHQPLGLTTGRGPSPRWARTASSASVISAGKTSATSVNRLTEDGGARGRDVLSSLAATPT